MDITWFKFSENAIQPKRGTEFSAGYDLYAAEDTDIKYQERKLIKTDIGVIIPKGYYARIAPRSSLAHKNGIDVFAGVIDADYRNAIGVILYNTDKQFFIKKGDRIAQIIFERCLSSDETRENFLSQTEAAKLPEFQTTREGGFGSTGK
jgi:dUTP pyrophosphatase